MTACASNVPKSTTVRAVIVRAMRITNHANPRIATPVIGTTRERVPHAVTPLKDVWNATPTPINARNAAKIT